MDYTNIKCCKEEIDGLICRLFLKKEGEKPLILIGLNPSTADETTSDATMRKILGFIEKWDERTTHHFDSFIMLNLYPLIETSPAVLNARHEFNPLLHSRNLAIITMFLEKYSRAEVLLCYGDSIETVKWLKGCRDEILKLLAHYKDITVFTLGKMTNMKNPRHPCRLSYSTNPEPFSNPFHFRTEIKSKE
ncbi:MAG: DUF1643 domain-containing protein [Muribaculaceae bacterium]|nr:DUF1643 domain-containing protein [Muribaculaceae bacterium]